MKLLLDMGLSRSTAEFLRAEGYDAVHLRERGLQRSTDHQIVELALAEERLIVTQDLDFGRIVALSRKRLPSVITLRLTDMRSAHVNRHLQDVLARFADPLTRGALLSVSDEAIRLRRLPVQE